MKIIKIFDKSMTPLTTFTEAEFTSLSHRRALGHIGEASFVLRLVNPKVDNTNIEMYNRVQIVESGVVRFLGVIAYRDVGLDTVRVRCREIPYILKKRLLGATYTANGTMIDEVEDLLDYVNGVDDTGITLGDVTEAIGSVNNTWKYGNAYSALDDICKATGNQFIIDSEGALHVSPDIGTDLSSSVVFRYNFNQVAQANILDFAVDDDGDEIVTRAYGKSSSLSSDQNDAGMLAKYGLFESFRDFRVANNQDTLDLFTLGEVKDRIYSPRIELSPSVADNFNVGDTVRVVIKNSLIDIDDSFQVLEKSVQYDRGEKQISVRINDLPKLIAQILNDRDRRLELLEKQV